MFYKWVHVGGRWGWINTGIPFYGACPAAGPGVVWLKVGDVPGHDCDCGT